MCIRDRHVRETPGFVCRQYRIEDTVVEDVAGVKHKVEVPQHRKSLLPCRGVTVRIAYQPDPHSFPLRLSPLRPRWAAHGSAQGTPVPGETALSMAVRTKFLPLVIAFSRSFPSASQAVMAAERTQPVPCTRSPSIHGDVITL